MYLVELPCITKADSRCCVSYTIRQHDDVAPPPSRLPTMSPAREQESSPLMVKRCFCCPHLCSVLPTHAQRGKPLTTHAAYTCFNCLHVYNLIAVHKTSTWNRQTPSDPECPGAYYVNVTYIKEVQWVLRVTSCIRNPFPLFTSAVRAAAHMQPLLSQPGGNKNTSQPGDFQKCKVGEKMFPYCLMHPNSFRWQFCLLQVLQEQHVRWSCFP